MSIALPAPGAGAGAPWLQVSWVPPAHLAMLLIGACFSGLAYESLVAIAAGPLVLAAGALPVGLWGLRIGAARLLLAAYARMFCVAWCMAGLAAGYASWLQDPFQLDSDAWGFYQLASGAASTLSLAELREISDGAGAVVLWSAVYDFAAALGIEKLRFVGIAFNTWVVSVTAAVALRTCRLMYGARPQRESRLMLMFGACGMLWIFAAIHLRDAMIFLAVTLVTLAWVRFLRRGGWLGATGLLLWMLALTAAFAVLRTEFMFVPGVASVIGLAAMVMSPSTSRAARWVGGLTLVLAAGAWVVDFSDDWAETLSSRSESYREMVHDEASQSSLGAQLVVNQPPAVRVLAGSAYLLLFPIPVWAGLVGDSALHLFKALNALFFYALLPLLAMALRDLARVPAQRKPERLFVAGLSMAFMVAIALTSLESRHFGSFLAPVFLLALVPDLDARGQRARYRQALVAMLVLMVGIHMAWASAKFGLG